jgi:hypothetical protein
MPIDWQREIPINPGVRLGKPVGWRQFQSGAHGVTKSSVELVNALVDVFGGYADVVGGRVAEIGRSGRKLLSVPLIQQTSGAILGVPTQIGGATREAVGFGMRAQVAGAQSTMDWAQNALFQMQRHGTLEAARTAVTDRQLDAARRTVEEHLGRLTANQHQRSDLTGLKQSRVGVSPILSMPTFYSSPGIPGIKPLPLSGFLQHHQRMLLDPDTGSPLIERHAPGLSAFSGGAFEKEAVFGPLSQYYTRLQQLGLGAHAFVMPESGFLGGKVADYTAGQLAFAGVLSDPRRRLDQPWNVLPIYLGQTGSRQIVGSPVGTQFRRKAVQEAGQLMGVGGAYRRRMSAGLGYEMAATRLQILDPTVATQLGLTQQAGYVTPGLKRAATAVEEVTAAQFERGTTFQTSQLGPGNAYITGQGEKGVVSASGVRNMYVRSAGGEWQKIHHGFLSSTDLAAKSPAGAVSLVMGTAASQAADPTYLLKGASNPQFAGLSRQEARFQQRMVPHSRAFVGSLVSELNRVAGSKEFVTRTHRTAPGGKSLQYFSIEHLNEQDLTREQWAKVRLENVHGAAATLQAKALETAESLGLPYARIHNPLDLHLVDLRMGSQYLGMAIQGVVPISRRAAQYGATFSGAGRGRLKLAPHNLTLTSLGGARSAAFVEKVLNPIYLRAGAAAGRGEYAAITQWLSAASMGGEGLKFQGGLFTPTTTEKIAGASWTRFSRGAEYYFGQPTGGISGVHKSAAGTLLDPRNPLSGAQLIDLGGQKIQLHGMELSQVPLPSSVLDPAVGEIGDRGVRVGQFNYLRETILRRAKELGQLQAQGGLDIAGIESARLSIESGVSELYDRMSRAEGINVSNIKPVVSELPSAKHLMSTFSADVPAGVVRVNMERLAQITEGMYTPAQLKEGVPGLAARYPIDTPTNLQSVLFQGSEETARDAIEIGRSQNLLAKGDFDTDRMHGAILNLNREERQLFDAARQEQIEKVNQIENFKATGQGKAYTSSQMLSAAMEEAESVAERYKTPESAVERFAGTKEGVRSMHSQLQRYQELLAGYGGGEEAAYVLSQIEQQGAMRKAATEPIAADLLRSLDKIKNVGLTDDLLQQAADQVTKLTSAKNTELAGGLLELSGEKAEEVVRTLADLRSRVPDLQQNLALAAKGEHLLEEGMTAAIQQHQRVQREMFSPSSARAAEAMKRAAAPFLTPAGPGEAGIKLSSGGAAGVATVNESIQTVGFAAGMAEKFRGGLDAVEAFFTGARPGWQKAAAISGAGIILGAIGKAAFFPSYGGDTAVTTGGPARPIRVWGGVPPLTPSRPTPATGPIVAGQGILGRAARLLGLSPYSEADIERSYLPDVDYDMGTRRGPTHISDAMARTGASTSTFTGGIPGEGPSMGPLPLGNVSRRRTPSAPPMPQPRPLMTSEPHRGEYISARETDILYAGGDRYVSPSALIPAGASYTVNISPDPSESRMLSTLAESERASSSSFV